MIDKDSVVVIFPDPQGISSASTNSFLLSEKLDIYPCFLVNVQILAVLKIGNNYAEYLIRLDFIKSKKHGFQQ